MSIFRCRSLGEFRYGAKYTAAEKKKEDASKQGELVATDHTVSRTLYV